MKILILALALVTATITSCSSNGSKQTSTGNDTIPATAQSTNTTGKSALATEVVSNYLQLKNALVNDNSKDAATAGKAISENILSINEADLTAEQRKVYEDVKDDIKEHGEHIGNNAGKIEHQREHFEMISKDVYDLVKVVGSEQTLFKDHCPMYNDGKGADWLSEVKDIKNPYLGKKMPTCGTVKEEIKK